MVGGMTSDQRSSLCARGWPTSLAGRIDEAGRHAREALALSRWLGARGSEAHALCLLGDVGVGMLCRGRGRGHYREALALASQLGMRPLVAHCHLGLGTLASRTGDLGEARKHLTTAAAMYREMGMDFWLEKAEAALEGIG